MWTHGLLLVVMSQSVVTPIRKITSITTDVFMESRLFSLIKDSFFVGF